MTNSIVIEERGPGDITLAETALLADCCDRTVRRAVHDGELPRRYAMGARGLQLVFARQVVNSWIESRNHGHHHPKQETPDLQMLQDRITQLQSLLDDSKAAISRLATEVRDQDRAVADAGMVVAALKRKLAALHGARA